MNPHEPREALHMDGEDGPGERGGADLHLAWVFTLRHEIRMAMAGMGSADVAAYEIFDLALARRRMRRPHADHDSVQERGVHVPCKETKQLVHRFFHSTPTGIRVAMQQQRLRIRHCSVHLREEFRHGSHKDRQGGDRDLVPPLERVSNGRDWEETHHPQDDVRK